MKRIAKHAVICLAAIGLGCVTQPPVRSAYTGPTESFATVVRHINENNSRIESLWTAGSFESYIVQDGKPHFLNGTLNVIYRRSNDLLLVAKKDVAGRIFEIGSNDDRYWLTVRGDIDTMWWGTHSGIEHTDPKEMPINPELLLDVLGVGTIGTNFKQPPVPVMRFNSFEDAYMIVWDTPLPDRWAAQREIWYDRQSHLPTKVILFDANGRVLLGARLSDHKPIAEVAGDHPPMIATHYELTFPDSGSTMSFTLNDILSHRGKVPNDSTFTFPSAEDAGVSHIKQVDGHAASR